MEILKKIASGIGAVAPAVANLVVPGSGPFLETLMRSVTGDPADVPIAQVAAKIDADPKLFLELQRQAMDHEARMARVEAAKLESVNATMRVESKSEHWPQYSWRPWNGFWFAPAIVLVYFVLPMLDKPVPIVPELVWIGWLAVLGAATVGRNQEKKIKAGGSADGLIASAIKAIRGDQAASAGNG